MEALELGPVPAEESCQQCGTRDYDPIMARRECRAYINQLIRQFGEPPVGARLTITSNPHDFGTYYEVAVKFSEDVRAAAEYAYEMESSLPGEWDDAARAELAAGVA